MEIKLLNELIALITLAHENNLVNAADFVRDSMYNHEKREEKMIMKTIKQLYADAITVQDASNLTGVVHGFSEAMRNLRALFPEEGTEFFNKHPIAVLWADKVKSLTGNDFSSAYREACEAMTAED